ncbi:MAG: GNAT family N-acetyltransferase [Saprospirales bacterium]|nr:GNAT family N-acetyltransferase [Saprospirales bacterium]
MFQNHTEEEIIRLLGLTSHADFIKEKGKSHGGYKTYDRTILAFLMISKESNETIGRCGFHNWYLEHHKAEIGYVLFKAENRRKGYMNEAINAVLEYGFKVMNLNRIEACTSPDNTASLSIIKKYGFIQEGYLRQHFVRDGETQDTVIYSLLKEEFEPKKGKKANTV